MRILFLTERFPYPSFNGGMLRTHHLIRGVAEHHEVDIACFANEPPTVPYPNTTVHRTEPTSFTRLHRAKALLQPTPVYPLVNFTPRMSALIREVCRVKQPDLCHVDTLGMAAYVSALNVPTVVDLMDCVSLHYKRLARIQKNPLRRALYTMEQRKIVYFERKIANRAAAVVCCTKEDADCVRAVTGKDVVVIRNGVEAPKVLLSNPAPHPVIVFLGFLEYPPNRDAVEFFGDRIWPSVLGTFPQARFHVFGKGRPVRLKNMQNVEFRGYVDDLASVYKSANAFVAPIRAGSGIKNKILEAMAHGVPVVATSLAVEGIGARDGQHYLVADTPEAFAAEIQKVFSSPELAQSIGMAGREFVQREFDWRQAIAELLKTYEAVVAG